MEVAKAQIEAAQAAIEEAQLNVNHTKIQAPISGTPSPVLVQQPLQLVDPKVEARAHLFGTSQHPGRRGAEQLHSAHHRIPLVVADVMQGLQLPGMQRVEEGFD